MNIPLSKRTNRKSEMRQEALSSWNSSCYCG